MPLDGRQHGQRAWDPARIHLSYHWLWLVPRELAHRSRTVPYHDGIRTDLGDAPVAPGARASLCRAACSRRRPGRLLAAVGHGGGGRHLVCAGRAAPAAHARRRRAAAGVVFAPLPLLVCCCCGAVSRCARSNALGADSPDVDVVWCAATLAAKPLILAHDALLEPTRRRLLADRSPSRSLVPLLAVLLILPRARPAVGAAGDRHLLLAADPRRRRLLPVLRRRAVGAGAARRAPDRARVGIDRQPVHARLLWLVVDWPFAVWLRSRLSRATRRREPRVRASRGCDGRSPSPVWSRRGGCRLSAPRVLGVDAARSDVPRARRWSSSSGRSATTPTTRGTTCARLAASAGDRRRRSTMRVAWLRERAPLRAGGAGVRRGARQEPDRRPGGIAAGLRRRLPRRRAGGDAAPAALDRRQPALHQRHRSDQRRAHLGRRVHDDDVAAAARSRRGGVPVSRQSLLGAAARAHRARLHHAVGGAVRARILEPAGDASGVRVSAAACSSPTSR